MTERDSVALESINTAIHLLLKGKYPEPIDYEGDSEVINSIIHSLNTLISQLQELYNYALPLARGDLDMDRPSKMNFLASSLKELHSKLIHLTWQAQQISNGDYGQSVEFMGDFSEAFNSMVRKLDEREKQLKEEINERRMAEEELRRKNRLITDSISYASIIQHALLPDIRAIQKKLPEVFAMWRPRDIVGGDFYWFVPLEDGFIIAVIDCTGHGVHGAFMTIAVNQMLKRIMEEVEDCMPATILNLINKNINESFYHEYGGEHLHAGLDMGVCRVDYSKKSLTFAGAKMPLFYVRKGVVSEIRGSKKSIGYNYSARALKQKKQLTYEDIVMTYESGDLFYITSDGYIDQNGTQEIYAFGVDNLKKALAEISGKEFSTHETALWHILKEYMGDEEQRDDIVLVGFLLR